ncbi:MAG: 1-deoxy-D-xylulose-5-phosphate synthase [Clostridia bacterium]|nr:1-deoxy-D-xylulose-5-phosphate synthase [Clostridia bacterium]
MVTYSDLELLKSIKAPNDLKKLNKAELQSLADEIRAYMISTVAKNGGHLASNLGIVELTIALHLCFDFKKDRLVFDVGHQCYPHKLLTGRAEEFTTLRTKDGISGFPKTSESEYDAFNVGHSSTAISAGLGMLRALRLRGDKKSRVVAVVGDGAMTGGLAYEALDDAGESELPFIVILNDNRMSISGNVGGLSAHLSGLRTSKGYKRFKRRLSGNLKKVPKVGGRLSKRVERFKNRIKYFILPNVLFEELGYTYVGPFDGHDITELCSILEHAKNNMTDKPVLIHVITEKGKGYAPAEKDPERFHGIGAFDEETGESASSNNNSKVFAEELCRLAEKDARIAAITAAMPSGTGLSAFAKRFPNRFFDVGIAEQHAVTMAAGMAMGGMKPIFAVYSTFLQRSYDQLLHDVCLQKLSVIFGIDRAGLVGADGETHQGVYDIAYLTTLPGGFKLFSPSSQQELTAMLRHALTLNEPCGIRYSRGLLPSNELDETADMESWQILSKIRPVTVVATGRLLENAFKACEGLDVGLVNARLISPIIGEHLELLSGAEVIITVEDGSRDTGFGAQLSRLACEKGGIRVKTLGIPSYPISVASPNQQDEECGLLPEQIKSTVIECMNNRGN